MKFKGQQWILIGLLLVVISGAVGMGKIMYNQHRVTEAINTQKEEQHHVAKQYEEKEAVWKETQKQLDEEITSLLQSSSAVAGIEAYDLINKETFRFNANLSFKAGDTLRIPLAMMVADKIQAHQLSLDDKITYQDSYYETGDGEIKKQPKESYTIKELLRLMLVSNDNIATNMLEDIVGGEKAILPYIQVNYNNKQKTDKPIITPSLAVHYLRLLYDNKDGNPVYDDIQKWMMSADTGGLATDKTKDKMGHHASSNHEYNHDIGIYYGDHPYIIAIYTKGSQQSSSLVEQISDMINKSFK